MKTLWSSVGKHKTSSPPLEPRVVFAGHILQKHVKRFRDLDYQWTISNKELAGVELQLCGLKEAFESVEEQKITS